MSVPADVVVDDQDVLPGVGGLLGLGAIDNLGERLLDRRSRHESPGRVDPGRLAAPDAARAWPSAFPARTNIVMQLHAPPAETGAIEDGRVAIYLAKDPLSTRVTSLLLPPSFGIASGIDIPADGRYTLVDTFTLPVDVEAVGARGHAHALAQRMSMTAAAPRQATARPAGRSATGIRAGATPICSSDARDV